MYLSLYVAQFAFDSPHPTATISMDFLYLSSTPAEVIRIWQSLLRVPFKGGIDTYL